MVSCFGPHELGVDRDAAHVGERDAHAIGSFAEPPSGSSGTAWSRTARDGRRRIGRRGLHAAPGIGGCGTRGSVDGLVIVSRRQAVRRDRWWPRLGARQMGSAAATAGGPC